MGHPSSAGIASPVLSAKLIWVEAQDRQARWLEGLADYLSAFWQVFRKPRPPAARLFRFDAGPRPVRKSAETVTETEVADEDATAEVQVTKHYALPDFATDGLMGLHEAQRLADIHRRAHQRIDSAAYSLSRLRMDLVAIAPGLSETLPESADQLAGADLRTQLVPPAQMPSLPPARRGIAA